MTNNLQLFDIDSAESKNCAFEIGTENSVLPELRFIDLHMHDVSCWAWENTVKSECNASGCGTCSATLETIKFDILNKYTSFFYIFIGQKLLIVQYLLMLNILYWNQFCLHWSLPSVFDGA